MPSCITHPAVGTPPGTTRKYQAYRPAVEGTGSVLPRTSGRLHSRSGWTSACNGPALGAPRGEPTLISCSRPSRQCSRDRGPSTAASGRLQGPISCFEVDHGEAVGAPAAVDCIASSHDDDTDSERPSLQRTIDEDVVAAPDHEASGPTPDELLRGMCEQRKIDSRTNRR
jgi:hypothetical protein